MVFNPYKKAVAPPPQSRPPPGLKRAAVIPARTPAAKNAGRVANAAITTAATARTPASAPSAPSAKGGASAVKKTLGVLRGDPSAAPLKAGGKVTPTPSKGLPSAAADKVHPPARSKPAAGSKPRQPQPPAKRRPVSLKGQLKSQIAELQRQKRQFIQRKEEERQRRIREREEERLRKVREAELRRLAAERARKRAAEDRAEVRRIADGLVLDVERRVETEAETGVPYGVRECVESLAAGVVAQRRAEESAARERAGREERIRAQRRARELARQRQQQQQLAHASVMAQQQQQQLAHAAVMRQRQMMAMMNVGYAPSLMSRPLGPSMLMHPAFGYAP